MVVEDTGEQVAAEKAVTLPRTEYSTTVMTPEQLRRRQRRNLAIGLAVGTLALLFYIVTIVKLGPGVLNRPM